MISILMKCRPINYSRLSAFKLSYWEVMLKWRSFELDIPADVYTQLKYKSGVLLAQQSRSLNFVVSLRLLSGQVVIKLKNVCERSGYPRQPHECASADRSTRRALVACLYEYRVNGVKQILNFKPRSLRSFLTP